jgi:FMN phosphatase YigB (HAD superfamily)
MRNGNGTTVSPVVFLLDVDNTLLNNDRVTEDLRRYLLREFGHAREQRYWDIFEQLRVELGYADYLGALQRYRSEDPRDPRFLAVSRYLINYPFANRLFPGAIDAVDHLKQWGPTVILSDGDVVFQPRKVERSGLGEAVDGNVLIYVHKELELDDVEQRYPSQHYVLVDDKLRILTAVKKTWGSRVTTVFPHQGHYAHDPKVLSKYPPADVSVERIGDLVDYDLPTLLAAGRTQQDCATLCQSLKKISRLQQRTGRSKRMEPVPANLTDEQPRLPPPPVGSHRAQL